MATNLVQEGLQPVEDSSGTSGPRKTLLTFGSTPPTSGELRNENGDESESNGDVISDCKQLTKQIEERIHGLERENKILKDEQIRGQQQCHPSDSETGYKDTSELKRKNEDLEYALVKKTSELELCQHTLQLVERESDLKLQLARKDTEIVRLQGQVKLAEKDVKLAEKDAKLAEKDTALVKETARWKEMRAKEQIETLTKEVKSLRS